MRGLLLAVVIFAVVGAIGGYESAGAAPPALAPLTWSDCGGGFQCATLAVPVDYTAATGPTMNIALIRLPAAKPAERIGSLLTNPGGPGGSGVDFVRDWAPALGQEIRDRFDIVGFDPRGVGQSSPIVCHDNIQAMIAADPSPDSQAEWDQLVQVNKDFAAACAAKYGDILQHLGTRDVARDLDRIRQMLDDDKLTYLGYSYGTEIGQVYADLFPNNIRAIVLDGAVDLSGNGDGRDLEQLAGFEQALGAFEANCSQIGCPLAASGDPAKAVDNVFAEAEAAPIPAPRADRPAGPGETLLGIIQPLYNEGSWGSLASAVNDALKGDGSRLVNLADRYLGREPNGSYGNQLEANTAVNCIDQHPSTLPTTYPDYLKELPDALKQSPHFGGSVNGLTCAFWPAKPDPIGPVTTSGLPPILVVDTTGDPATPYQWGVAVSQQIDNASLLTHNGQGHTAYLSGNNCIDAAVNRYLINLTVPDEGTVCKDNAAADPSPSPSTTPPVSPSGTPGPAGTPSAGPATSTAPTATPRSATPPRQPTPVPTRTRVPSPPRTGSGEDSGSPWFFLMVVGIGVVFAAGSGYIIWWQMNAAGRFRRY